MLWLLSPLNKFNIILIAHDKKIYTRFQYTLFKYLDWRYLIFSRKFLSPTIKWKKHNVILHRDDFELYGIMNFLQFKKNVSRTEVILTLNFNFLFYIFQFFLDMKDFIYRTFNIQICRSIEYFSTWAPWKLVII